MVKPYIFYFILFFFYSSVSAHHKVYSPRVDEGRLSLEWRGHYNIDSRKDFNKEHHHVLESEFSWTNFWQSEIEFHLSDKSGTPFDFEKLELQNQVQIYDSQNYAAALYFSYNFLSEGVKADEIEYKFLSEYENDYFKFLTNFIFEKQVGKTAEKSTEFSLTNYILFSNHIIHNIKIGVIGFSEFGYLTNFSTYHNQEHLYGIQFEKDISIYESDFELVIGLLKGLTSASAESVFIWNLELEF